MAASLIYRALLSDILDRGFSRAYSHAARYYGRLAVHELKIQDWGGALPHREYLALLWEQHSRKYSFWNRVGGRPG